MKIRHLLKINLSCAGVIHNRAVCAHEPTAHFQRPLQTKSAVRACIGLRP